MHVRSSARRTALRLLLTHGTATGRAEGAKLLQAGDVQVWQPWDTQGAVLRVHPTLIPREHPLASVRGAFNAVFVEAENAGELMFYGQGAGGGVRVDVEHAAGEGGAGGDHRLRHRQRVLAGAFRGAPAAGVLQRG